jgi:hypothetical protein
LFGWLRNFVRDHFRRESGFITDEKTGIAVETDDPLMAEVVARAFTTGKPVVGSRDESGNVRIEKLEP